ncbi:hypothetical protein ABEB36_010821 [Hypothenemus hampei]|uniref:Uncharacterized protein n=1 Tax=Hypothenemus hampei TaxID=57062 RepID=A0ABD1EHF5_HYPHA
MNGQDILNFWAEKKNDRWFCNAPLPKVNETLIKDGTHKINSEILLDKPEDPYATDSDENYIPSDSEKKDFCFFCETEVLNYARHVFRNHSQECEIAQILAKPCKSKERRFLLDKIRRKGNFLASTRGCFKPVRQSELPNRSLLPCDNCLGFFLHKTLYRHRKKCAGLSKTGGAQTSGYTLLSKIKVDRRLAQEVFPHMRPDLVSFEAKNDEVICAFGARYYRPQKDKHFVSVVSRKMRKLSKIVIELRKLEESISDMFSALKPKHFDLFVEATKNISGHNEIKCSFKSPNFAMNIVTLKQCCDIALSFAYKRHESFLSVAAKDAEANIKTLIMLFNSNWKFEISSHANQNLSLNKWNKVTAIPLASDLKLLRKHLINVAEQACKCLQGDSADSTTESNATPDGAAFDSLIESVYCRVILLNRKRSGELQQFETSISQKEQILLKSIKRVVIRGKRGRGVPVLFSPDIQEHIKILIKNRDRLVPKENLYLFAKSNSKSHIVEYKILGKYPRSCGAKNPQSLTSTRLRKHLATLSQLFNLKDHEIEKLATFMGHTIGVHRNSYRLPDDVYQTTKIAKPITSESTVTVANRKKFQKLVPWTSEQKKIVKEYFKENIKNSKQPVRIECEKLKSLNPTLFENKDWLKIKVFIQNEYTKNKLK